jgi:hypothetical protein
MLLTWVHTHQKSNVFILVNTEFLRNIFFAKPLFLHNGLLSYNPVIAFEKRFFSNSALSNFQCNHFAVKAEIGLIRFMIYGHDANKCKSSFPFLFAVFLRKGDSSC